MKRFLIVLTGPTNIPCHFTNPFSYRKKAKKVKKFPIIVYPSRLLHSQDHIAPIAIFSSPFCCRFSSSGGQDISGSPDICTLAAFCVGQLLLISSVALLTRMSQHGSGCLLLAFLQLGPVFIPHSRDVIDVHITGCFDNTI